jgi:hypothetical protein
MKRKLRERDATSYAPASAVIEYCVKKYGEECNGQGMYLIVINPFEQIKFIGLLVLYFSLLYVTYFMNMINEIFYDLWDFTYLFSKLPFLIWYEKSI